jgi:hypothetical protein
LLLLAAGLAVVGWMQMATTFMVHDDEGYVLLGLRDFCAGGKLYEEVFTQYGPAPYLYYGLIHDASGAPITNTLARSLALVHWVVGAVAAGLVAWRLSQRYWAAWFTSAIVFCYLWQMTWEPGHPGGWIVAIVATALAAAVEAMARGKPGLGAFALGLAGALLLFTKVNVGLLWCASSAAFLLLGSGGRGRSVRIALAAAGLACVPCALMFPLLGDGWVLSFAVVFALSALAVCAVASGEPAVTRPGAWWAAPAGVASASVVILGGALAHGTSLPALLDGVFVEPLRLPANFHVGFEWPWPTWVVLSASAVSAALWRWRPAQRSVLADVAACGRLGVLAVFVWHSRSWSTAPGVSQAMSIALASVPFFLLPIHARAEGDPARAVRFLVALIGLGQTLHAYPVAGSQVAWGSFLLLPFLAGGLCEAVDHVERRMSLGRKWRTAVAALALCTAAVQSGSFLAEARRRWQGSHRLELPGAESVRPPEPIRLALRVLTANAGVHADVLFSRPGMYGFNLWSGLPTPTGRNATHWFWLLGQEEQQEVVERLRGTPRTAVICSRTLTEFLDEASGIRIEGPLNDFLDRHYRRLFTLVDYDFLVPSDSRAVPFFFAASGRHAPTATEPATAVIRLNVAGRATVARVVLSDTRSPRRVLRELNSSNCRVTQEPINASGQSTARRPRARGPSPWTACGSCASTTTPSITWSRRISSSRSSTPRAGARSRRASRTRRRRRASGAGRGR